MENSCSFGLRYVLFVLVQYCHFSCSHLEFWSGNSFVVAPFPDHCLPLPFLLKVHLMLVIGCYYNDI